ncbi:ferric reductase-like transmembrane domain-containing protein [Streptomyces sp. NPDC088175]|uniref:ferredoxin reductase family protein n=1 Tax=unclassified Streptomyces TaxID=2593676 RepID=UPI003816D4DF
MRISPESLWGGLIAGAVWVLALWAVGMRPTARLDELFAMFARLTGLLAGYGVLGMFFLMARVPAVEHGVGADRLARWHSRGGRWVLTLCLGHALLTLCGSAVRNGHDVLTSALRMLGRTQLALAMLGLVLLCAAGVVSARAIRGRIPHEIWRAVHLLTYLGAALGIAHQLTARYFAANTCALWLWALLHIAVVVLLVRYRIVVPVRQALRHNLRVLEVRAEGPAVFSVVMRGDGLDELAAEAGQFFRWRFLQRRIWHSALPFSLSAPVRDDKLRITVKAVGNHTRRIRRLKPGTRVLATGPFGAMTAHRRKRRKVLLLAGGVGITPMRALFETLPGGPGDITLLYRAGSEDQLVLREELEAIAAFRQAGLHYLLGPSDASFNPLAPQTLRGLVPDLARRDVYLCGPHGMTVAATAALVRAGVPQKRIHTESFAL